jgi:hypothetical protein
MLSATPCQPKERNKNHGDMRNMITASSHVLSLSSEGVPGAQPRRIDVDARSRRPKDEASGVICAGLHSSLHPLRSS